MADLHLTTSTYQTGTNDTYTTLADFVDDVLAVHQNGPASAIIGIETILGTSTTLIGSKTDLATRLGIAIEADGKVKDFSATTKTTWPVSIPEGGTGSSSFTDGEFVYYVEDTSGNTIRSSGLTLEAGSSGDIVTRLSTQNVNNKTFYVCTLDQPTIGDFTNAAHSHLNATGGGLLGSDSVGTTQVKTTAASHTTAAFNADSGVNEVFTVTGTRIGDFTISSSDSNRGTCHLYQVRESGAATTAVTKWNIIVDNDGVDASSGTVTVGWYILGTVT